MLHRIQAMEMFKNKPRSKSKMVSLTVVLISLSVLTTATEPRKCYWCGPLAEQVHKSTRAPPCNEPRHVTTCDPGYNHCAVVASNPPYTESRMCVKIYQDECYSLYCNTTRIWRMTCPCIGDLCNGPNTEREKEAFSILDKLVDKSRNTRIKRTVVSPPSFISHDNSDIDSKTNETPVNTTTGRNNVTADINNEQSDEATNNTIEAEFKTTEKYMNIIKIEVTEIIDKTKQNDKAETVTQRNIYSLINNNTTTPSMLHAMTDVKQDESSTISEPYQNKKLPTSEALQQNRDVNQTATETAIIEMSDKNTALEMETSKSTDANFVITTVPTTIVTASVKQELPSSSETKPSKESPTAEALQQNSSIHEKVTESLVTKPADKPPVTTINNDVTPETLSHNNNTATKINNHILTLLSGILLHHCF